MDISRIIKTRRSIRRFRKELVPQEIIGNVLEAGRWAPSGLNNQPWRFIVLDKEEKDALAGFTKYAAIIKSADKIVLMFIDKGSSYNYEKDLMAIGSCAQNMLLYIHSQGYGACWLGEILNKREEIQNLLRTSKTLELEVVIALGRPLTRSKPGKRDTIERLMAYRGQE